VISFAHLEEVDEFWTVAADEEADVGECGADAGGGGYEEVDAFSVCQAGEDDDGYCEMLVWTGNKRQRVLISESLGGPG
jgi:hypothetical protein